MAGSLENEIREQLIRYLSDEISLEEFQAWLMPLLRDIEDANSPLAEKLAYAIATIMAEYSSGNWTKPEFKRELICLIAAPRARASLKFGATHDLKVNDQGEDLIQTRSATAPASG